MFGRMDWGPEHWSWKPDLHRKLARLFRKVPHALNWIGRALAFGVYALLNIDRWNHRAIWASLRSGVQCGWAKLGWIPRNYLPVIAALSVVLAPFWLWLIWRTAGEIVDLFVSIQATETARDRRDLAYAFGVNVAALAGLVAAPLVIIRAWVSERHTKTAEEGLITDRFTKAVEQLGAEKTVKRREFKPQYKVKKKGERGPAEDRWEQDTDGNPIPATRPDGTPLGEWQSFEETAPNLEVRLGATYALERIAQDSERDHIPIMETLCAYIRENSQSREPEESPHSLYDRNRKGDRDTPPMEDEEISRVYRVLPPEVSELSRRQWADALSPIRVDVQAALSVIGRRHAERIAHERHAGFQLDLRETNLQRADLTGAHLERALLPGARLEGAILVRAHLAQSHLGWARLEAADLEGAQLENAYLGWAKLQEAQLIGTRLMGAKLGRARLEGADLMRAQLDGAFLMNARLERAFLMEGQLSGADLREAHLQGADLRYSLVNGANLHSANLRSADLRHWVCARASLRSADFSNSKNLTQEQINSAFGDSTTILPEGIVMPDHWDDATIDPYEEDKKYQAWLDAGAPAGKPRADRA